MVKRIGCFLIPAGTLWCSVGLACVSTQNSLKLITENGYVDHELLVAADNSQNCVLTVSASSGDISLHYPEGKIDRSETAVRKEWLQLSSASRAVQIQVRKADPEVQINIRLKPASAARISFEDSMRRGDAEHAAGNHQAAITEYSKAVNTSGIDETHRAVMFVNLSLLMRSQSQGQAAVALLSEAVAAQELEHPWRARLFYERAAALHSLSRLKESESDLCMALALLTNGMECATLPESVVSLAPEQPELAQWIAEVINRLGLIAHTRGNLSRAEALYKSALTALDGDAAFLQGLVTSNLGGVAHERGDWSLAQERFATALDVYQTLGDEHNIWSAQGNLANSLLQQGDINGAIGLLQDTLARVRRDEWGEWEADQLDRIGALYLDSGDYVSAEPLIREALDIRRSRNSARLGITTRNLGTLMRLTEKIDEAIELHGEARALADGAGKQTESLACALELARDFQSARRFADLENVLRSSIPLATELGSRARLAELLLKQAGLHLERQEYRLGLAVLDDALAHAGDTPSALARIHSAGAQLLWRQGQREEAIVRGVEAYTQLREARRRIEGWKLSAAFYDRHYPIVSRLVDMYVQDDQLSAALAVVLESRNYAYLDQSLWKTQAKKPQLARLREQKQKLAAQHNLRTALTRRGAPDEEVAKVDYQIAELTLELDVAEAALATQGVGLEPLALTELVDKLESGHGVLVHYLGSEMSWQWLLTPSGMETRQLPSRDALQNMIRDATADIATRVRVGNAIAQLGEVFGSGQMQELKKLYVLPDGVTATVPYSALPNGEGSSLADHLDVQLLSSIRQHPKRTTTKSAAIFVGPEYLAESYLPALPHSIKEGRGVAARLDAQGYSVASYSGKQAQKTQFLEVLQGEQSVVHVAVHGLVDAARGRTAGLRFSDVADDPLGGFLSVSEIEDLDISARLVVLSACDGALGESMSGEAPYSLARAFKLAGGKDVLATLWPLGDRFAAEFMAKFYEHWLASDDAASALRETQVYFKGNSRWRHPSNWAAFMVAGSI